MEPRNLLIFVVLVSYWAAAADSTPGQPVVTNLVPSDIAVKMGQPYYSGAILPTPRHVKYHDEYVSLIDGPDGKYQCDIEMAYDGPASGLMTRLLQGRFERYTSQFPDLQATSSDGARVPVLFALVTDKRAESYLKWYKLRKRARTLQSQGYLLEIRPTGILCVGYDNTGLLNGLASFLQLTHVRDDRLVARCASVCDWPTFTIRYTSEYHLPGPDFFDWMMLYKINGFASSYRVIPWEGLSEKQRAGLKAIGDYISAYQAMNFMVQFHIGGRGGRPVDCGNPDDVNRLLETITETMRLSHAQHVMICYDDVVPELQPEEQKLFNTPAEAHGAVMEQVYQAVKRLNPDTVVSFCSPYYHARQAYEYTEVLRTWKNKDVRIVWTGPVVASRWINIEDISLYTELVGEDRSLVYWDNTWHYHQPLRNFHAQYLDGFVDYCADRTSYINVNGVRPIGRFFAVTANDYYWNPEAFDSKRTRRHAVAQFMGPRAVRVAEEFYDLRGEDYFAFFTRDVNLRALRHVFRKLQRFSLDTTLPQHCWAAYEGIVESRKSAEQEE